MFRISPSIQSKQIVTRLDKATEPVDSAGKYLNSTIDGGFPIDLIRFSIQADQRKKHQHHSPQGYMGDVHAAPLISINHRDVTTLDDLFLGENIQEIFDDVHGMLQKLVPAPCWDEDPFALVAELF